LTAGHSSQILGGVAGLNSAANNIHFLKQPETDLEELALSYVGLLRDWTNLFNASQGWTSDLQ
jgi:hypothetical protein